MPLEERVSINDLPDGLDPTGPEKIPAFQNGGSVKLTHDQIIAPAKSYADGLIAALKAGVSSVGDTLQELYDLILLRAPIASPAFTGAPTAPTPTLGDDSTKIATTSFVQDAVGAAAGQELARRYNVLTPHEKLVGKRASNSTLTVTADALTLFDASGNAKRFTSINVTVDIAAAVGAGALDAGTEANSTWYKIFAIGKADGTKSAVLSTGSTPTLPADYIYCGLVGYAFNNASGHLSKFHQRGARVGIDRGENLVLNGVALTANYTAIDLSAIVPPDATAVLIEAALTGSGGVAANAYFASEGSGTTPDLEEVSMGCPQHATQPTTLPATAVLINTPQQIKFYTTGTGTVISARSSGYMLQ